MSEPSKALKAATEVLSWAVLFGVAALFFAGVFAVIRAAL
jgi:hypothetical protein